MSDFFCGCHDHGNCELCNQSEADLARVTAERDAMQRVAEIYQEEAGKLTAENAALKEDAARYRWLAENAGRWEVIRDNSEWTKPDGSKVFIKARFSAFACAYLGYDFIEALDAAIDASKEGSK